MNIDLSTFTKVLAVSMYSNYRIYPPENNHCITILYNTNPYIILIPKFLLLTTAVIINATSPIVNPLIVKVTKSNQSTALDQNLMFSANPAKQNTKLMITTSIK